MRTKAVVVVLVFIIMFAAGIYINNNFLFSPLTFKRDSITYLPYNWYAKPMAYSYMNYDNEKIKGDNINNEEEIKLIYKELKKSRLLGPIQHIDIFKSQLEGRIQGGLYINSSYSDGCTVTDLKWFGSNSDICEISGSLKLNGNDTTTNLYIKMTPELKEFLNSKLSGKL
ncbi:MAG: hypothetical protein N3I35_05200 [Clostridia bacterium]|nr:hypothetical protein [Clostridia bacterium]